MQIIAKYLTSYSKVDCIATHQNETNSFENLLVVHVVKGSRLKHVVNL